MANVDALGRNGYRRQADLRLTTIMPNGLSVEQNAHIKQKNTLIATHTTGTGGASKISKKVLSPILMFLTESQIPYYFDRNEYGIRDIDTNNYYFFDLTITKYNIAIEYQSAAWHANPTWDSTKLNKWSPPRGPKKTARDVLAYDQAKAAALLKHRNIVTHYIWEDSANQDIDRILCLLKIQNTIS